MSQPWSGWDQRWAETRATRPRGVTIDVHSHLLVPESAEMVGPHMSNARDARLQHSSPETLKLNRGYIEMVRNRFTEPQARLEDMERMGIDVQLVSLAPPQYFYWLEGDLAPAVAAAQNDRIAAAVSGYPHRLVGLGTLPMRHPEAAVAEADRLHDELGFPGVEIGADIDGLNLDDRRFDPIWDRLAALGLVVLLHPAGYPEATRLTDYYLVNVVGIPLSSTVAVSRMILGGVFQRHPELRVVICHGGGYLGFYWARTDHAFKHRPELQRHIDRPPSEYLEQLYFDTVVFDPTMLRHLIDRFGVDRVLLGTDYPFDMGEGDPLALITAAGLSEAQINRVAGANAIEVFGLSSFSSLDAV